MKLKAFCYGRKKGFSEIKRKFKIFKLENFFSEQSFVNNEI